MIQAIHGRGRIRLGMAMILVGATVGGLMFYTPRSMALIKVGQLIATQLDVRVKHPDAETFILLKQGKQESLLAGDVIQTMSKGTAELTIHPKTQLTLLPESVLAVRLSSDSSRLELQLLRGKVQGTIGAPGDLSDTGRGDPRAPQAFATSIDTASATIITSGATILAQVENEKTTIVKVFSGQVRVRHISDSEITVGANQEVEVSTGAQSEVFKVSVLSAPEATSVPVQILKGFRVTVPPADSVVIEKRLKGTDDIEIHLVAPPGNKQDLLVEAGDVKRQLAPNDSAVLTFRQPQIVILGINEETSPAVRLFQPPARRKALRDSSDLGPAVLIPPPVTPPAPAPSAPPPPVPDPTPASISK